MRTLQDMLSPYIELFYLTIFIPMNEELIPGSSEHYGFLRYQIQASQEEMAAFLSKYPKYKEREASTAAGGTGAGAYPDPEQLSSQLLSMEDQDYKSDSDSASEYTSDLSSDSELEPEPEPEPDVPEPPPSPVRLTKNILRDEDVQAKRKTLATYKGRPVRQK